MSINRVTLLGNLGKDPTFRSFQNGGKVCNFSVATSEKWKDRRSGEWQEKTEWHNVSVFAEHVVTKCEKYLKKGTKVYLEGMLQTRKWKDQQGNDKYTTEVVIKQFVGVLEVLSGGRQAEEGGGAPAPDYGNHGDYAGGPEPISNDDTDEVPF